MLVLFSKKRERRGVGRTKGVWKRKRNRKESKEGGGRRGQEKMEEGEDDGASLGEWHSVSVPGTNSPSVFFPVFPVFLATIQVRCTEHTYV